MLSRPAAPSLSTQRSLQSVQNEVWSRLNSTGNVTSDFAMNSDHWHSLHNSWFSSYYNNPEGGMMKTCLCSGKHSDKVQAMWRFWVVGSAVLEINVWLGHLCKEYLSLKGLFWCISELRLKVQVDCIICLIPVYAQGSVGQYTGKKRH